MIYDIDLPEDGYYANMYDIESLTSLTEGAHTVPSELSNVETSIRRDECDTAKHLLRDILTQEPTQTEANMLQAALWVKDRLFTDLLDGGARSDSPKSCALQELSQYLGKPVSKVEENMVVEVPVAEDWNSFDPDPTDADEVDAFYETTDAYVYELMAANHIIQTLYSYYTMILKLNHMNVDTVLDYGAGAGTLCILLDQIGYNPIYADLPGETFRFANWRFEQRDCNIPTVNLEDEDVEQSQFDCILCTEVIEHIVEPIALLEKFGSWLATGEVAVISESCEYTEDFATHLERNEQYGGDAFFDIMQDLGFDHVLDSPYIPQHFFLKN